MEPEQQQTGWSSACVCVGVYEAPGEQSNQSGSHRSRWISPSPPKMGCRFVTGPPVVLPSSLDTRVVVPPGAAGETEKEVEEREEEKKKKFT